MDNSFGQVLSHKYIILVFSGEMPHLEAHISDLFHRSFPESLNNVFGGTDATNMLIGRAPGASVIRVTHQRLSALPRKSYLSPDMNKRAKGKVEMNKMVQKSKYFLNTAWRGVLQCVLGAMAPMVERWRCCLYFEAD